MRIGTVIRITAILKEGSEAIDNFLLGKDMKLTKRNKFELFKERDILMADHLVGRKNGYKSLSYNNDEFTEDEIAYFVVKKNQ